MPDQPPSSFARVGGQSVTQFKWGTRIIAFAHQISVQSPTPVAQTTPIHPLNARRPVDLITPFATTMGSMELELYELFGKKIWEDLAPEGYLGGVVDLADIFVAVAKQSAVTPIGLVKEIIPYGKRGNSMFETFHDCVISTVEDGETIQIGTMEVLKKMTVNFTHSTWARGTDQR